MTTGITLEISEAQIREVTEYLEFLESLQINSAARMFRLPEDGSGMTNALITQGLLHAHAVLRMIGLEVQRTGLRPVSTDSKV